MHVIDSHTGGEPTRVVVAGFPDLGRGSMAERRLRFSRDHDSWRSALVCEPRGSDAMVGALLVPPDDPEACTGVIFFNNVGTLGMCGHGAIGVVRSLVHLGRIGPGRHRLDTPVGAVDVELSADGSVVIANVESRRLLADVAVDVPGYGTVRGDVAWGGNWFFITEDTPHALTYANWRQLTQYTVAISDALSTAGIRGDDGPIDHIEINTSSPTAGIDGRNFVLCPGFAYDRSPCGTGTSAKLACLAADGKWEPGRWWRQESILGSVFHAQYTPGPVGILPRIRGRAHITADCRLLIEDGDPFAWGVR